MASIWDFLNSLPKRGDVSPEELAARRQGYADLYQGGLLARNRDQMPLSVQGAQATQDFLPVIGDALALGEAGEALSRGELAAAGLLGAGAAIGLVPGAGDALAKPVMAAGRRAADIARRIEVDPNAFGSMGGNIRLKPEDVTPAQEVAGLLSSGRVDEVTDEMLAKLTPKDEMELFDLYQRGATGMDLPMDEASRMARAGEIDAYHGTDRTFSAFDPTKFGEKDPGWYGRGVTTDTDPEVAAAYANYDEAEIGQQIIPVRIGGGRYMDWPEGQLPFGNPRDSTAGTKDMQSLGYVGSKMTNDRDLYGDVADIQTEYVTFDPSNVRSRFARFDPRLAHLRNLSAGVGGLGLLSSIMPQEEQY